MLVYLISALVWGTVGVALLVWRWLDPQADNLTLRWTHLSAGWFALALAAYNLVRWWSVRALRRQDRTWAENQRPEQRFSTIKPDDVPDATFNFDEPPDHGTSPPP